MKPYQIIEIANCHGGDYDYLVDLITEFQPYTGNFGMKFQAFKYDSISTADFPWYGVYQQLFFDESQWKNLITLASQTKDIWLDLFDDYGVKILEQNFDKIYGLKFQASVLYNYDLMNRLSKLDLSDKLIIINIASYSVDKIGEIKERIKRDLSPKEILLEIGFQAFPTRLEDSGFSKIETLKKSFSERFVFADHVSGESEDAIWSPVLAAWSGIPIIEKHVMHETRETKYDHFSSLKPSLYKRYIDTLDKYMSLLTEPFINEKELEYLRKSILVPLSKKDKERGEGISLIEDCAYKRSGKEGLNSQELMELVNQFNILGNPIPEGSTFQRSDFKKANIATIIACRLKSSRLPKKALLKIGQLSSVEKCIKNALEFRNVHHVILATSNLPDDAPLKDYTYSPRVVFHQGSPDDVIQRYLDIIRVLKIDVIVRVTADCPYVDDEICQLLLESHFKSGADYTTAKEAAVGTNLEIINTQALEKVKRHFREANYSEYMTWYFKNNPEYFKLNYVELPQGLVRNYRMTLDYQEDLDMFARIEAYFEREKRRNYSLRDVYKFLDENPEVVKLNQSIPVSYKSDKELIDLLNKVTKINPVLN